MANTTESEIWADMLALRDKLRDNKPLDRGESGRRYAVVITQLELTMSYFNTMVQMKAGMRDGEL